MSLSGLEIGKRALLAQRLGLDITSNNISNVNTPGYSRRTPNLAQTDPLRKNGQYQGTGVIANRINTFRNQYLDKEIKGAGSRLAALNIDSEIAQRIESILAEPSELGINEMVTDFFNGVNELVLDPQNMGHRQYIVNHAKNMAQRINVIANNINDLRSEVLKDLDSNILNANSIIKQIADLNTQIVSKGAGNSQESQTLIDQREVLLEDLSEIIDVKYTTESDGSINVFTNGLNLITKNVTSELRLNTEINQETGERTIILQKYDPEKRALIDFEAQGGEIYSNLKSYNITLDELDSSDEFSVATDFNEFITELANQINGEFVQGYGLNDTGENPPGRALFEPSNGDLNIFNITVNEEILDDPALLGISDAPGEPGNTGIGRAVGRIADNTQFFKNQRPSEYYSAFLGRVGLLTSDAVNGQQTTKLIFDQLQNQRESAMGVNLDEEAVNLIKYQRAFEAATRVVTTSNELLQSIVNLGR